MPKDKVIYIVTVVSSQGLESCELFATKALALANKKFIKNNNNCKNLSIDVFIRSVKESNGAE